MKNQLQAGIWATASICSSLKSVVGELPLKMQDSDGTAMPLVVDDSGPAKFGADVVRFPAGGGVALHTHVGAHILLVTWGFGYLTHCGEKYRMFPGLIYLIKSNEPHAIEAETELVLVAVGNDHRPADSPERLDIVQKKRRKKRGRKPARPNPAKT